VSSRAGVDAVVYRKISCYMDPVGKGKRGRNPAPSRNKIPVVPRSEVTTLPELCQVQTADFMSVVHSRIRSINRLFRNSGFIINDDDVTQSQCFLPSNRR
jgi:hypothetical protein